jgi:hypothetical protein
MRTGMEKHLNVLKKLLINRMNRYSGVKPEYYIKELSEVIIRLSIHEHLK